jgi:hypothetical protein
MTGQFRKLAAEAGFEDRVILTRSVVDEARNYLGGQELSPGEVKDLVTRLKHEDKFGSARKVLAKVREARIPRATLRTWFAQQHALCTYKDPDLPVLKALDQALAILEGSFDDTNVAADFVVNPLATERKIVDRFDRCARPVVTDYYLAGRRKRIA